MTTLMLRLLIHLVVRLGILFLQFLIALLMTSLCHV